MKRILICIILFVSGHCMAQIGYQVSLLNSATGEPRANETVTVEVEISNSENTVICSETKSATTNDFGVLSLKVGTSSTFENVDWSKLPLYVSATVDGIMVGRSQILNVPVAEAAKTLVNVDLNLICKTWSINNNIDYLSLNADYTFHLYGNTYDDGYSGTWYIEGNKIILLYTYTHLGKVYHWNKMFIYHNGILYEPDDQ